MAETYGLPSSYDIVGRKPDVSEILAALKVIDTTIFGLFGAGKSTDKEHKWYEDKLVPNSVTANEANTISTSATTIKLTADHANRLRPNVLLMDVATGKAGELLRVVATEGNNVVVARGYGSSTATTHAKGAEFRMISQAMLENASASEGRTRKRDLKSNYCQIFERVVDIGGSAQVIPSYGVANELAYQTANKMLELKQELDDTLINGIKSSSIGSATVVGTLAGLIEVISATGGNIDNTAAAISHAKINNLLYEIFLDCGDQARPTVMAGHPNLMRTIRYFDDDLIQIAPSDTVRGTYVNQYRSDLGWLLTMIMDRNIPMGTVLFLDQTRLKLCPLRPFKMTPMAKTGDFERHQIVGEFSCEVRNALEAHAIGTGWTAAS